MSEGRFFGRFRAVSGREGDLRAVSGRGGFSEGGGLAVLDFLADLDFLEQLELLELLELPEEPGLAAATRRPRITLYIDRGMRGREKRMWG